MEKFEEVRNNILHDNRSFIPRAEINYIRWLTRKVLSKSASTIIVEFAKAGESNKIIYEGPVWQGKLFRCERCERQRRSKQCFN